jgi:hypothetical protein
MRPATVGKYRNRRLYHTFHRRHLNLEDIVLAPDENLSGLALGKQLPDCALLDFPGRVLG